MHSTAPSLSVLTAQALWQRNSLIHMCTTCSHYTAMHYRVRIVVDPALARHLLVRVMIMMVAVLVTLSLVTAVMQV
jgi:hypothetical protein